MGSCTSLGGEASKGLVVAVAECYATIDSRSMFPVTEGSKCNGARSSPSSAAPMLPIANQATGSRINDEATLRYREQV
jgi:hypothetical protein